jgi:hypothetical protein
VAVGVLVGDGLGVRVAVGVGVGVAAMGKVVGGSGAATDGVAVRRRGSETRGMNDARISSHRSFLPLPGTPSSIALIHAQPTADVSDKEERILIVRSYRP